MQVQLNNIKTDLKQLFPGQLHAHLIIGIPSLMGRVKQMISLNRDVLKVIL